MDQAKAIFFVPFFALRRHFSTPPHPQPTGITQHSCIKNAYNELTLFNCHEAGFIQSVWRGGVQRWRAGRCSNTASWMPPIAFVYGPSIGHILWLPERIVMLDDLLFGFFD